MHAVTRTDMSDVVSYEEERSCADGCGEHRHANELNLKMGESRSYRCSTVMIAIDGVRLRNL
jgi:hypothetical protein